MTMPTWRAGLAALLLLASAPAAAQSNDPLVEGFANPPDEARPMVYWQWVNGNVSEEGIRSDFAWMDRVGLGGVFMMDIGFGSPPVPQYVEQRVGYGTPEWESAIRVAAEEAARRNISFGMQSSGGWSVSGGPSVTPQAAMRKLVWTETVVTREAAQVVLPPPPGVNGPYQDFPIAERFREPTLSGDIAVLAFRLPEREARDPPVPVVESVAAATLLWDGRYSEAVSVAPNADGEAVLHFRFAAPVAPGAIVLAMDGAPEGALRDETGAVRAVLPGPARVRSPVRTYALDGASSREWALTFTGVRDAVSLREARFVFGARVHRVEEKAAFGTLEDYEALRTAPVTARDAVRDVIDVSAHMDANGALSWRPRSGTWLVQRFGWSLTGRRVVPAPGESLGFEVDKLSADAVREFAEGFYDRLQTAAGSDGRVDIAITDSWEAGALNWTAAMRAEFQRRRGYDPLPWLPVLTGRVVVDVDASERFLGDWRRTIAGMIADNHYGVFAEVLAARGMTYYAEAPGTGWPATADGVQARRRAAAPMGEFWVWPANGEPNREHIADIREAASAARIEGRTLVAAEALTSWGDDAWSSGPREWRPMVDRFFAEGVTRVVMHTMVHQPFTDRRPGITLRQFGQHFSRNEAWAELADGWIGYLSRASFLLQQGVPVRDVAVFYGEDAAVTPYHEELRPPGYDMDFIDAETLFALEVRDGALATPAGARYRALQLRPGLKRVSVDALEQLQALADAGALIVGEPPEGPFGLGSDQREFDRLVRALWPARVRADAVSDALAASGVRPDVSVEGDGTLHWAHRAIDGGDLYFMSNPSDSRFAAAVTLRAENAPPGARIEAWDAATGRRNLLLSTGGAHGLRAFVFLPARSSTFLVVRAGDYRRLGSVLGEEASLLNVAGPWRVSFLDGMGAPTDTRFASLSSWTEHSDAAIRYYSGRAIYRTTFRLPTRGVNLRDLALDLGAVGEMARVRVNGQDAGMAWNTPNRVEIGALVREGVNDLEIEVANYWRNRLIGDQQPDATRYTFAPVTPYEADDQLRPSGLMGPVRLVRLARQIE